MTPPVLGTGPSSRRSREKFGQPAPAAEALHLHFPRGSSREAQMRRANAAVLVMFAMVATLAATAQPAQALTIRDVVELSRAGLTDDVLVALIEVDAGVFPTDTATLKALKEAGVSDRVMIALIRSGRERRVEEPPPSPVV